MQITNQERQTIRQLAKADRYVMTLSRLLAEMCDRVERLAPALAFTTEIARQEIAEAEAALGFTITKAEERK